MRARPTVWEEKSPVRRSFRSVASGGRFMSVKLHENPHMKFYDIFNGDADGICALQQLRLEEPRMSVLVTGVKRDIGLLERVKAQAGDELTVLDIPMPNNARE